MPCVSLALAGVVTDAFSNNALTILSAVPSGKVISARPQQRRRLGRAFSHPAAASMAHLFCTFARM